MKKIPPLDALILALLLVGTAVAQSPATAAITANQAAVTVGDPIQLTIAVTHPTGAQAIFPTLAANWGDFIVRSQSPVTAIASADGTTTSTQLVDVRLFAPGAYQTPPLTITIADAAGQTSDIQAAPISLNVQSVLVEGDTTLRDIKPQAALPFPAGWPWMMAGLVAIVAFVVWLVYRRVQTLIANRLPHEIALAVLADVEKQRLAENGRFQTHYSHVTDALRTYVEQTQPIPATDRTTSELKAELQQTTFTKQQAQQFIDLLQAGDLVKFARVTPTLADAHALVAEARQFIQDTQPAPTTDEKSKMKERRPATQSSILNLQSSSPESRP